MSDAKEPVAVAGAATGAGIATTAAIKVIGFGTSGVIAGSKAALIQAGIGNVAAGGWFAMFTSIGMTSTLPISLAAGGMVIGGYGIWKGAKYFISSKEADNKTS